MVLIFFGIIWKGTDNQKPKEPRKGYVKMSSESAVEHFLVVAPLVNLGAVQRERPKQKRFFSTFQIYVVSLLFVRTTLLSEN